MLKRYGIIGFLKIMYSFILTKTFYNKSRLIRFPFDIRNRKNIDLGYNLTTGVGCRIEAHPIKENAGKTLILGNNIEMNDYVHIAAGESVVIGNNVLLASKIFISDINHGSYTDPHHDSPLTIPNKRNLSTSPILIEDNVWLGESVCVLPGVTIGKGSIIGSLSVVTKNIPPFSIAVGSPAKVIKTFDFNKKEWVKNIEK